MYYKELLERMITHQSKKRKVQDEPIILDTLLLPKLAQIVQKVSWNYKVNIDQLQLRDRALVCFFILTGIRNTEHQSIKKKQTRIYETHILVVNVQPKKHGKLREEIILPKAGGFAPFTAIVQEWLQQVPDDNSVLFPSADQRGELDWSQGLSRQRVHWIIKTTTGMFPHWFRGVCETIYGKQVFKNDAWALKDFMGLVNLDSTSPYVNGQWKVHEKNVYEVR
jgi:integrase